MPVSTDSPTNCFHKKWNKFYFPKRYIVVILAFWGMCNRFAMQVSISMTIVAMVNQTATEPTNGSFHQVMECRDLLEEGNTTSDISFKGEKFNWDTKTQGMILGAYYYGYMITQLPGGVLAEKIGTKWVLNGGILFVGVLSLLVPYFASLGATAFAVLRVLQGLADGLSLPAINSVISTWSPTMERSKTSTLIFSGTQVGTVVSMAVSGLLCTSDMLGGWPSVYYILGVVSCVWFCLWSYFIYETPSDHPSISREELLFIEQNKGPHKKKKSAAIWKKIFTSIPMWALIITHVGHNFGFLTLLLELPTYLSTALHFDMRSNGFLSALPFIVQAIGAFLASFVADNLRKSGKMSITTIRKLFNSIGEFGPAVCLVGVALAGCRPDVIVVLLTLAMAFNGCIFSGYNITHVDMCPDFAGTLFAISSSISNLSGVLGPLIVGLFVEGGATLSNWGNVFYMTAAVYGVCGLVFVIFGSAELQQWGVLKEEDQITENEKNIVDIKFSITRI